MFPQGIGQLTAPRQMPQQQAAPQMPAMQQTPDTFSGIGLNLIQAQERLKDSSDGQLMQYLQSGGGAPPSLVLAELNRRKRVRDAVTKPQQPTVADELVGEVSQRQAMQQQAMQQQAMQQQAMLQAAQQQAMQQQAMQRAPDRVNMAVGGLPQDYIYTGMPRSEDEIARLRAQARAAEEQARMRGAIESLVMNMDFPLLQTQPDPVSTFGMPMSNDEIVRRRHQIERAARTQQLTDRYLSDVPFLSDQQALQPTANEQARMDAFSALKNLPSAPATEEQASTSSARVPPSLEATAPETPSPRAAPPSARERNPNRFSEILDEITQKFSVDADAADSAPPEVAKAAVADAQQRGINIPLVAMGLSMMASENPRFAGALGEAGLAGLATYVKERERKDTRADIEAERAAAAEDRAFRKQQADTSTRIALAGLAQQMYGEEQADSRAERDFGLRERALEMEAGYKNRSLAIDEKQAEAVLARLDAQIARRGLGALGGIPNQTDLNNAYNILERQLDAMGLDAAVADKGGSKVSVWKSIRQAYETGDAQVLNNALNEFNLVDDTGAPLPQVLEGIQTAIAAQDTYSALAAVSMRASALGLFGSPITGGSTSSGLEGFNLDSMTEVDADEL
jgi:hypothetical protein